jgi:hypothetical protein
VEGGSVEMLVTKDGEVGNVDTSVKFMAGIVDSVGGIVLGVVRNGNGVVCAVEGGSVEMLVTKDGEVGNVDTSVKFMAGIVDSVAGIVRGVVELGNRVVSPVEAGSVDNEDDEVGKVDTTVEFVAGVVGCEVVVVGNGVMVVVHNTCFGGQAMLVRRSMTTLPIRL